MQLKLMPILVGAMTVAIVATPVVARAKTPQNSLADTYHPGFWQPVAQINPNLSSQIKVINESQLPLQYGLTTDTSHPLSPGSSATLNGVPLPANLLINPTMSNRSLKYDVAVADNVVTVRVQQFISNIPGDSAINIQPNGGVYIY